ncbi:hypothetical protein CRE_26432 [Caenorhabditis remanei]|uniref:Uncharacterized protein n=1 Tax=Caenorhabditis remanei TaxID=31234 RepID=E3LQG5_CAERE|nr:hypothetical protein CRE_26432 [Caenorhabditis remanei]
MCRTDEKFRREDENNTFKFANFKLQSMMQNEIAYVNIDARQRQSGQLRGKMGVAPFPAAEQVERRAREKGGAYAESSIKVKSRGGASS